MRAPRVKSPLGAPWEPPGGEPLSGSLLLSVRKSAGAKSAHLHQGIFAIAQDLFHLVFRLSFWLFRDEKEGQEKLTRPPVSPFSPSFWPSSWYLPDISIFSPIPPYFPLLVSVGNRLRYALINKHGRRPARPSLGFCRPLNMIFSIDAKIQNANRSNTEDAGKHRCLI